MNVDEDPKNVESRLKEEAARKLLLMEEVDDIEGERKDDKSSDAKNLHLRDKKRRFAISLATLSANPKSRAGIVEDGAILTLVKLARQPDRQTQLSCAAAFNSLASESSVRATMLQQGAVGAIVNLSLSPLRKIKNDCARALCNLAASAGMEEELVRLGAVGALLSVSTSSIQLMEVVLMALLNLSCVDERFSRIDEVNDAVLHLSTFSMNARMEKMLVSCICNLTALKNNQARLVEEGVVRLLTRISRLAPLSTQRLCATSFCNLSSCSRSRGKMTDQRVVPTLLEMVKTGPNSNADPEIKRYCAITVSRLAMDVTCREKVVQQGAVAAIVEMCMKRSKLDDIETDRVCAAALNMLSLDGDSSDRLIQDGAVPALLKLIDTGDALVCQDCAHCLCVLFQFEAGINEMIDFGAVTALVNLADPENDATSGNCALALYNLLSHEEASRVAGKGILTALVSLSQSPSESTKRTCAAALWELTTLQGSDPTELIPALIQMLTDNLNDPKSSHSEINGDCAAALYNLAQDVNNCNAMMRYNVLKPLLGLVKSETFGTRVQCGAILSRLSFEEKNRQSMANPEFLKALFELANLEPDPQAENSDIRVLKTQQRMVNAIYNISCDKGSRKLLLDEEVLGLSAAQFLTFFQTKPAENIRRGCAAALCNLLSDEGTELGILQCGAVSSLLITALVASDKEETKNICCKCLYNLLSDDACHEPMVREGVLWGFAALCKSSKDPNELVDDVVTTRMCSRAFCNLSCNFTSQLLESNACVKTVFLLTTVNDPESKEFAVRGVLNMLSEITKANVSTACHAVKFCTNLCLAVDERGGVENAQIHGLCILAFCIVSQFPAARKEMRIHESLAAINFDIVKLDPELSYAYAASICNMSLDAESRRAVIDQGVLPNLLELALSVEERTVMVVARCLYYCTCDREKIVRIQGMGVIEAIQELLLSDCCLGSEVMHTFLSSSLFNLATEADHHLDIVNKDAVQMIRVLWENANDEVKRVCALATANLSCGVVNSAKIVGQQGTDMIVKLALSPDLTPDDGMWCVAALRNLLSTSANHRPMLAEGVVDALVKLADHPHSFISLNSAAALRTMTYNQATRAALIEKNAINVIIDDSSGGGQGNNHDDDDLKISNSLLQKIEAESWANGSRGIQREGRAAELDRPPLRAGLSELVAVLVEVPMLYMGWDKVQHFAMMEEPTLERSSSNRDNSNEPAMPGSPGDQARATENAALKKPKFKELEVDTKVPTKICAKMECELSLLIDANKGEEDRKKKEELDEELAELNVENAFLANIDAGGIEGKDEVFNRPRGLESSFDLAEGIDMMSVGSSEGEHRFQMKQIVIADETELPDEGSNIDSIINNMGGGNRRSVVALDDIEDDELDEIGEDEVVGESSAPKGFLPQITPGVGASRDQGSFFDGADRPPGGGADNGLVEMDTLKLCRKSTNKSKSRTNTMMRRSTSIHVQSYKNLTDKLDKFKAS
jgi:hypothetical protein